MRLTTARSEMPLTGWLPARLASATVGVVESSREMYSVMGELFCIFVCFQFQQGKAPAPCYNLEVVNQLREFLKG